MRYEEVAKFVASLGLDYAYYLFPENGAPDLPYIIYFFPNVATEDADDTGYSRIATLDIELYTDNKDFSLEEEIEEKLIDAGFSFNKQETYISSENMYEQIYEMEVVIDG